MTGTITFMNSGVGRSVRFLFGVGLIVYGLFGLGNIAGTLVAVIGLAPIALAVWGHCLLEPLAPDSTLAPSPEAGGSYMREGLR